MCRAQSGMPPSKLNDVVDADDGDERWSTFARGSRIRRQEWRQLAPGALKFGGRRRSLLLPVGH